jgi:hypothetical protein
VLPGHEEGDEGRGDNGGDEDDALHFGFLDKREKGAENPKGRNRAEYAVVEVQHEPLHLRVVMSLYHLNRERARSWSLHQPLMRRRRGLSSLFALPDVRTTSSYPERLTVLLTAFPEHSWHSVPWLHQSELAGIMDDTVTLHRTRPKAGKDSLAFIE